MAFFLSATILSGCSVAYNEHTIVEDPVPTVRRLVSLHQLQKGLTRAEVRAVLGDQVIIGYEMPDSREKRYVPVILGNPYRTENFTQKNQTYTIDYYLVGINAADGKAADDELTPLVFEDNTLIGWGWDFWNRIRGLED